MKQRMYALLTLLLGIILLVTGLILPIDVWENSGNQGGIIGGADSPTYWRLLISAYDGLAFVLVLIGGATAIAAGFCVLFFKTVQTHCVLSTSAIALGLSALGGVGLCCAFYCVILIAFSGRHFMYPIRLPVLFGMGFLCLIAFIGLIALYFILRLKKWSAKGFVLDVLTADLFLPGAFVAAAYLIEVIDKIRK